ncbi:MAG: maltose alpha-D-glucosyltransferase [Cellvibrio sp.]|uniref:maltose alpha-D-glucosyltransferase n=1 Tax=Cellvibrio sp. TaxID=1965322 RepID=UPI00271F05F7|nr:maltose alpha-D-glucosyltransferase [Cellvibrio sp.]
MTEKNKHDNFFKNDFLSDVSWYKDAIIYQAHVKSFFDANNDGVGDFVGLMEKLDYIVELGVNAIWLLPFYPSPMRDDGYDIAEYRSVHPAYGTLGDVKRFIAEAHKRGLRIITELVINHTSDQHAWFQKARRAKKDSKARNFYVWSDTNQKYAGTRIIFSDTESSNWTWDPIAGQYFWHRFYSNQPDLNFDNPDVLKEVLSIMRFWFDIGVDGLRLDAIPYLVEREGTSNENLPETHEVLKKIRAELDANYPDRLLLAEANLWPEDIQQYFGNGDECHMAFHFPLMPRMYMAIAQEDRFPIIDILRQMPEIPANCQWAIFLRNHDELTLEMVTDQERDYLWNHYAADQRARINLGIRRRLAPLVERDRRRIELLNSLLLSMPGTPTLYYGDEIGMGDNIFLGDRHGVRTPMQWSDDRNGGFSRADPASLIAPAIMDPLYGFQSVNVEAQARDTHSLLNWTRRILAIRKQQKAFGRGNLKMLTPANRRILSYLREYTSPEGANEIILCVANVSRAAQAAELDLSAYAGKIPVELIGGTSFPLISKLNYQLTLPPYGFYWFLLVDEAQMPSWYVAPVEPMPELTTIIIKQSLLELTEAEPVRAHIETESLPVYLPKCAWFVFPGWPISGVELRYAIPFGDPADLQVLTEVAVKCDETEAIYFLPLGVVADHLAGTPAQQLALARLRQKRRVGLLTDAFTLPDFSRKVMRYLRESAVLPFGDGELHFNPRPILSNFDVALDEDINLAPTMSINGSVIIGEKMRLKPLRKVMGGIHPEVEMGAYLSDHQFPNIAPVYGEVKRVDARGENFTLMILQDFISNQGDAWQWIQNTLQRALRDQLSAGSSSMDMQYPALQELTSFSKLLGQRLGEMHAILAQPSENPRFGALPISAAQTAKWVDTIAHRFARAMNILRNQNTRDASWLVARAEKIQQLIAQLGASALGGIHSRIHGNLNLAQVLVVAGDAYFVNFEDSAHQNPLKDVADILCTFNDAAALAVRNAQTTDASSNSEEIRRLVVAHTSAASAAFYNAYVSAANDLAQHWPQRGSEAAALALFCLDNRAREIIKAEHRPDWLDVPLRDLTEMILKHQH